MNKKCRIHVFGDVVLDGHLYGGVKIAATSLKQPGTVYFEHLGGAVLTHKLLNAAAEAAGTNWDKARKDWNAQNEELKQAGKSPLPWPSDIIDSRPEFDIHLGIDTTNFKTDLPGDLRSYGVWTPHPAKKKNNKDRVWRAERHFGYGQRKEDKSLGRAPFEFRKTASLPPNPAVVLLDDGGICFRHQSSQKAWPNFSVTAEDRPFLILKMSWPLCRGDLWARLVETKATERLLVVVAVEDLRHEDAQIHRRLSWEQCASDTLHVLMEDPIARELLRVAHVVVNFRSAGALWLRRSGTGRHECRLIFDPVRLEGDFSQGYEGTVYGFQTCLAAAIVHHLALPRVGTPSREERITQGIISGLAARRRLIELGHGPVAGKGEPGLPIAELGQAIHDMPGGFMTATVPVRTNHDNACPWTILAESEKSDPAARPRALTGLAKLTARFGLKALSHVPALQLGKFFTVDRGEIESLRTLEALLLDYEKTKVQKKPLSIGVFGPPGAGKSFAVKALAEAILGEKVPFLEFNLSQFKSPDELIGAFHRVRDAVLGGITPVAFWDEFDSQKYEWLQYLLAPMQDGKFQSGEITHPIGKCVFIFAGGTSASLGAFGVREPIAPSSTELARLSPEERAERRQEYKEQMALHRQFKLLKGPDFISRLHGFLNVLGPNPGTDRGCPDITWPIRRALILRGIVGAEPEDELDIDAGLLHALLSVPEYRHGARSFEKIVNTLQQDRNRGRLHRSALPPPPLLDRETCAEKFHELLTEGDAFKSHPDIETLAATVHEKFLSQAKKSKLDAIKKANPHLAWTIHPAIQKSYDDLDADSKASNRAAARRIADHLALIGHVIKRQKGTTDTSWKKPLATAITKHIERIAQAEHLGWCAERISNGWTYAAVRNNSLKHHPLLVPWSELPAVEQEKDRASARSIPGLLDSAKYKAVPAPSGASSRTFSVVRSKKLEWRPHKKNGGKKSPPRKVTARSSR